MMRPGWHQVLQYNSTVAAEQFICLAEQLEQAKDVCCVRTALYRIAGILIRLAKISNLGKIRPVNAELFYF